MANMISERGVKLLRRHRDDIATRCNLWFEQTRTLLAEALRTDPDPQASRELAVLEDRVLLSATPIVESVELADTLEAQPLSLSTVTVTQTADIVNGDTDSIADLTDAGDGANGGGGDGISLREAILAANNESGPVTILLGPGTFLLDIEGADNEAGKGDLDLNKDLTIQGAGAGMTIIDASGIHGGDRVFHARNGAILVIEGVTITGGQGKEGAGVLVEETASLTLRDVVVSGNDSSGRDGGGISNHSGTLELIDVTIADNSADNKEGGGIHNSGTARLNRVTVSGNQAKAGAGIYSRGGSAHLSLTNVTISGNHASGNGGGLYVKSEAEILHSTIAFNTASSGGGIEAAGATIVLKNSILANNVEYVGTTAINVQGKIVSQGHNIDSDGTANLSGTGDRSNVDPLLCPDLDFNGGKTRTHALMPSSIARDLPGLTGAPAVDQRGVTRDAHPDVGAYEFDAGSVPVPVVLPSQVFHVVEYSVNGTVLGTIRTTDPDWDPSHVEWTIVEGNANGVFAIDATTGELTVADQSQLDSTAPSGHILLVTVSDGTGTATAAAVKIEVDNAAPTDIILSRSRVPGDTNVDLGNLNASRRPSGTPAGSEKTADLPAETDGLAPGESDDQASDADSNSEGAADSTLVSRLAASQLRTAHSAANKAGPGNRADALLMNDSRGAQDAEQRGRGKQGSVIFTPAHASAHRAASSGARRGTEPAIQEEFRPSGRLSQRISLVQRAVVQPQLWQAIEEMNEDVHRSVASVSLKVGATATTTAGITAGYVVWVLRSGLLMSTAFAHLPMWRFIDPLAVLDSKGMENDEDGESLQSMVAEENQADPQESATTEESSDA